MGTVDLVQSVLQDIDSVVDGLADAVDIDEVTASWGLFPEFVGHFGIIALSRLDGGRITVSLDRKS